MKFRLSVFFIILIISGHIAVKGQKDSEDGFIVTTANDTIYGQIDIKSNLQNGKSCLFRDPGKETLQNYTPEELVSYRTKSKYYVSKEISIDSAKQRVFLEYLVDGIADLYYLKEPLNEYYFIEKDGLLTRLSNEEKSILIEGGLAHNDRTYIKNSNQYKGVLNYLFQDGKGMSDLIAKTDFQYRSLINLTKDYHNTVCSDYRCIDFTRSTVQKLFLELGIGLINTSMGLRTSPDHIYNTRPAVSAQLRFIPLKSNSHWNFLIGMNYSSNDFKGYFANDLYYYSSKDTFELTTSYSILRIPLNIEYIFGKGKIQPLVFAGYNACLLLSSSHSAFGHLHNINYIEPTAFRRYHHGITSGAGIIFNLNKNYLFLRGQYEYRVPSVNGHYVFDYVINNSWIFTFGYAFSL
jgi:hypothetical protein